MNIRMLGQIYPDDEGCEFASLKAASQMAKLSAREIVAEMVIEGDLIANHAFEIADEQGRILEIVLFKSLVTA